MWSSIYAAHNSIDCPEELLYDYTMRRVKLSQMMYTLETSARALQNNTILLPWLHNYVDTARMQKSFSTSLYTYTSYIHKHVSTAVRQQLPQKS